jgi:hypothetical protein
MNKIQNSRLFPKLLALVLSLGLMFPAFAQDGGSSGSSRMGFQAAYNGSRSDATFVYDLGFGLEVGAGLGVEIADETAISLGLQGYYQLKKALLPFGVGLNLGYNFESGKLDIFPNFQMRAELVKNVGLNLGVGVNAGKANSDADMVISLGTQGALTFYFM